MKEYGVRFIHSLYNVCEISITYKNTIYPLNQTLHFMNLCEMKCSFNKYMTWIWTIKSSLYFIEAFKSTQITFNDSKLSKFSFIRKI